MIMIRHLNPRSENILPSHDAQLELQSVHEATQFRKFRDIKIIDLESIDDKKASQKIAAQGTE